MATAKDLIEKHQNEDDRAKVSLYLSRSVFEKFKKSCRSSSASKVMEDLMKMFLDSLKTGKDIDL